VCRPNRPCGHREVIVQRYPRAFYIPFHRSIRLRILRRARKKKEEDFVDSVDKHKARHGL